MTDVLRDCAEVLLRLITAITAGAVIGFNRFLHHKPAGFGTHALVSLGAALGTLATIRASGSDTAAVSRVIQGLVTGVGFIGAGEILRGNKEQDVHGLTTAASVWTAAMLGISSAIADFTLCITGMLLTLIVLVLSKPLEDFVARIMGRRPGNNQ